MAIQQLILISGMGGSGKTTALHTLEDLGFYCMDNFPLVLLSDFMKRFGAHPEVHRLAVSVDIRERLYLGKAPEAIHQLRAEGCSPELLFLDASDSVLLRRYKETRRIHPLDMAGSDMASAIKLERETLKSLEPCIQTYLNTSSMTIHALRAWVKQRYAESDYRMRVAIVSFGYKNGILQDADLVFDVRFLNNPFFVPELSRQSGRDKAVQAYVFQDPDAGIFLQKTLDFLHFLLPKYAGEGKHYLTIAIGCTGGQHRSVAIVEAIYEAMAKETSPFSWQKSHRDMKAPE
ncbi:MAG: RNase adapter RapZ [Proteobacteria bacterium]|nr:RNase adapter RapZ [Pseudomonadota bacterium]